MREEGGADQRWVELFYRSPDRSSLSPLLAREWRGEGQVGAPQEDGERI